jgi:tetratricopeptide (TPR) repeat protein
MRNALVSFASVASLALLSVACESTAPPPPAEAPPPPQGMAPPPPPPETPRPPPPPQKLVSITTSSAEARALLLAAWDLGNNLRFEEALETCKKAVAADPKFALGLTCVGSQTSGAEGQALMDAGVKLSAGLPEAERLAIEAPAAYRRHETEKYYADLKRITELAPDDPQGFDWLGWSLTDRRDFAGARAAFKHELELNPGASYTHGSIAWTFTQERNYPEALAAAKRYVEGAPTQPAAHQGLGQALINVGQIKEADAELTKAVATGARARWAFYDLAEVKGLEGDFAAARDVLERSKATEVQATDALDRSSRMAWALFAEGKVPEAFALIDAAEKDADEHKLPWPAHMALVRVKALWALGKPVDAMRAADVAMDRCARPESSELYKGTCRTDLLTAKAFAQIRAGRVIDVKETVAKLQDEAKKWPANEWLQTDVAMLTQQVDALAKHDRKADAAVLAKCPPDGFFWKFSVLRQLEKDGDKAGAEQVRTELLGRPIKDMAYAFIARLARK